MSSTPVAAAQRRAALQRAIALTADAFASETEQFGKQASTLFTAAQGNRGRSQIQQLLTIANNAQSVSEVLDFIKRQVGKDHESTWRPHFGPSLIEALDKGLRSRVRQLDPKPSGPFEEQQAHLALIRRFIGQLYANYEFYRAEPKKAGSDRNSGARR
ncbi:MAG: hypothetical protein KatS3mg060_2883 [Dehalococcoidia bacterium]|nr:MAG: hypothetical protein KatS3mg060_2883 [Dehalococcoidia bacterium]